MIYIPQELMVFITLGTVAAVHYLAKWRKYWAPLTFIAVGVCFIVYIASFGSLITTSGVRCHDIVTTSAKT